MFHRIIRIPNKTFEDLSLTEVASMIEADSALCPNGNREFSSCALDEFLHSFEPKRADLREIQVRLLENIYLDQPGTKVKAINTSYLKDASLKLRRGDMPDTQCKASAQPSAAANATKQRG